MSRRWKRKQYTIFLPSEGFQINYGMCLKRYCPAKSHPRLWVDPLYHTERYLTGFLYVLRSGCQWKMLPKEYGSGSVCHRRFQEWNKLDVFKNAWIKLLEVYDAKISINWTWQSIDSISIKSPLGGPRQEIIPLIEAN
jgi:transposase